MKKVPFLRNDIDENFILNQSDSFYTLDGYVFDETEGSFSYDNDFDETLPILLTGVKNPNQEERKNSSQRKYYFPRKLLHFRKKPIEFWKGEKSTLTEILSAYPQLSAGISGIGNRKANEILALVIYLNSRNIAIHDLPLGGDLYDTIRKRCKANNYEGNWRFLSKILNIENNPAMASYDINENFSKRSINGNYLPLGEKIYKQLFIVISVFPVTRIKRKRGYSDKGSRKDPSTIHECSRNSNLKIEVTREIEPLTGKKGLMAFLFNTKTPARKVIGESTTEIDFRKKLNKQLNQLRRQEEKRVKTLQGKVITYNIKDKK